MESWYDVFLLSKPPTNDMDRIPASMQVQANTLAVEELQSHRRVFSSMRYSLRLWLFVAFCGHNCRYSNKKQKSRLPADYIVDSIVLSI